MVAHTRACKTSGMLQTCKVKRSNTKESLRAITVFEFKIVVVELHISNIVLSKVSTIIVVFLLINQNSF